MSIAVILFLTAASGVTACMTVLAAFGGGMLLVAMMASVLDYALLIPIYGAVMLMTASWRLWLFRGDVDRSLMGPYLLGMVPGAMISGWVYINLIAIEAAQPWIKIGFGAYLVIYLVLPKIRVNISNRQRAMSMGGFLSGVATMIVGAVGPVAGPFFAAVNMSKLTFVAASAVSATMANLFKAPTLLVIWDRLGPEHLALILAMGLAGMVGAATGRRLIGRINDQRFVTLVRIMMGVSAAKLIAWDGIGRLAGLTG
jgi:uncharacterized protein